MGEATSLSELFKKLTQVKIAKAKIKGFFFRRVEQKYDALVPGINPRVSEIQEVIGEIAIGLRFFYHVSVLSEVIIYLEEVIENILPEVSDRMSRKSEDDCLDLFEVVTDHYPQHELDVL